MAETLANEPRAPGETAPLHAGWAERGTANAASWRGELLRAALIAALSAAFALSTNCLRDRPVPLLASDGPAAWPDTADRITVKELKNLLDEGKNIVKLDVRAPQLFKTAHPAQAFNAPAHEFMDHYQDVAPWLDVADMIVVICNNKDCPLGDRVAHILIKDLKHEKVRVLDGGWEAYQQAGLAREGDAP